MRTVAMLPVGLGAGRSSKLLLADLGGRPLLYRVVERTRQATTLDEVVVVTSSRPVDDPLAHFCDEFRVTCFRSRNGDASNGCCRAARRFRADVVVRLMANCPLLDAHVIDRVVWAFRDGRFDYASNTLERTYPAGLDTEVVSRAALEQADREAQAQCEREDSTVHIVAHPERFRLHNVRHERDLSALRWTVEAPGDLNLVRDIYERCGCEPLEVDELADLWQGPACSLQTATGVQSDGGAGTAHDDHFVRSGPT